MECARSERHLIFDIVVSMCVLECAKRVLLAEDSEKKAIVETSSFPSAKLLSAAVCVCTEELPRSSQFSGQETQRSNPVILGLRSYPLS
jgi:hypothetical protein